MSPAPFISYAQNGEDVVLFRALRGITDGRYVDVGANDPVADSVTYAFYQRGWSGITVDPMHYYAERQRAERPRDVMIEAAVSDEPSGSVILHQIADTGLSSLVDEVGDTHRAAGLAVDDVAVPARRLDDILTEADWAGGEIHFLLIDTEGAERAVLNTIDLAKWRPWVLVVEATRPQTTEPSHDSWEPMVLAADYRFCLFDGLSRFYVAAEKWDELGAKLSAPANILDNYRSYQVELRELEIQRLTQATVDLNAAREGMIAERDQAQRLAREHDRQNAAAILQWRTAALRAWAQAVQTARTQEAAGSLASHLNHITFVDEELRRSRIEVDAMRATMSWRVTKPLRWVRGLTGRANP